MKVIALSGIQNTGKTTVLGDLHRELLTSKGYTSLFNQSKHSKDTPITVSINKYSVNDFIDIYEKKISSTNSKKIKIGLMTEGDFSWKITRTLDYFLKEKCDYAILASRIGGNHPKELASINGYFIHIHKEEPSNDDNIKVLSLLKDLIP